MAEDDGLGGLYLDKKKKKKKKATVVNPVRPCMPVASSTFSVILPSMKFYVEGMLQILNMTLHHLLVSCLLQEAAAAGEAEDPAEDDADGGQGLDLSLTKKKKKRKPKARTDDEFGAMVEDPEGAPAEGTSCLILLPTGARASHVCCTISHCQ